ncbi:3-phosphoshikimate 1-carboxyvinyltransferase (5-enolpyruvoylshikimate-3-phosphate synthase) [Petrocella atlantisensis]|uniref:3-phosphoshikimate 1-carboxyvinyltransferase n=1 Tax=Petrocella atlantisensis TaxID=2173034 RepID=A0A3P7Q0X9_9FIRM|nr:3-phosphoshikimate 1-carboxyvinyltransferase [Petrocella atlantisensis]VDN49041.1 3-phosphoshikimate 1-carboxyvinyltransferase (5-enolpyruvoylshikimate-3-phosphate synthase) [Petrocella atlantisensis]
MHIQPVKQLKGTLKVPGDKSISHRSIMFGALAKGTTTVEGFLTGEDCLSTIACFRQMGIHIEQVQDKVTIQGKGLYGLTKPNSILDVGNSGTTMRLMSGILSGQSFEVNITGDASIRKRPMDRIIRPLTSMNANISSLSGNGLAPLSIKPSLLKPIDYISPVASAQVKSSILLANLYTGSTSTVKEPTLSRNHSEIMLNHFGAHVEINGSLVTSHPIKELFANHVVVPSDISSAAFFMVAGLICPNSDLILKDVGINPTRDGIIHVLKEMNGSIEVIDKRVVNGEPIADLHIKSSKLKGTIVEGDIIPTLIDEIPVIAVAAAYAEGTTIIKDAGELKVKETNRIDTMVSELKKMNIHIEATADGMIIVGGNRIQGAHVQSYDDHRVAMSLAIAALGANGHTRIENSGCIAISYPTFESDLSSLIHI